MANNVIDEWSNLDTKLESNQIDLNEIHEIDIQAIEEEYWDEQLRKLGFYDEPLDIKIMEE